MNFRPVGGKKAVDCLISSWVAGCLSLFTEATVSQRLHRAYLLTGFLCWLFLWFSLTVMKASLVFPSQFWQLVSGRGELCWRVTEACGRQKWWLTRNVKDSLYQACPPKLQIMLCSSQSGRLEFPGIWPQNVPGAPKQNYQNPGWPTQNDISLTNAHAIKAVQTPCISRRGNEVADVIMHFVLQLLYMDPPRAYE